jgi:uncharacterized protein (TIGR02452 family)
MNGHNAIVLSAMGCGAYRNPPSSVAKAFQEVFLEGAFKGRFRHILFAIFGTTNIMKFECSV